MTTPPARRTLLAALVALVAAVASLGAAVPAGAQTDGGVVIEDVDASDFPLVRATVSGPLVTGEPDDAFVVLEGEQEVDADVVRLRTDQLSVVVAIDVSGSMEGDPLVQAKAAVGALLDNLPETVPVSVVSFGETAIVSHEFSTDHASIRAAVDGLIAAGGTAFYDGVERGLAQLSSRSGTGALVVLADGADSTSVAVPQAVTDRLAASTVDASFVVLRTEDLDVAAVEALAAPAGAAIVTVDAASDFGTAFGQVAAGLGTLFEIRWRSASESGEAPLTVALAADRAVAASTTFVHDTVTAFVPDIADDITVVGGGDGLFSADWIPLAAALAISVGAVALVFQFRGSDGATARREERRTERDERRAGRDQTKAAKGQSVTGVQQALEGISAQVLEKNDRGRSLDEQLDRAGLAVRSNEFVVVCAAISLAAMMVGVLLFGVPYFVITLLVPAAGVPGFLKFKQARRRKAFCNQLGDTLQLMAGSLTAGYGLGQTLDSVARETESPTCEEFQRVVMETRLGRSLEDALDAMSHRIGAQDFDWVVDAIKIQSSVGGNLSEIIAQVGETIRARTRIRRQVDALTAEGKISAVVLFCLPLGLFGFIYSSNPGYISPMFSSGLGQVMLGAAVFMLVCGGLWLKKLVNPEF